MDEIDLLIASAEREAAEKFPLSNGNASEEDDLRERGERPYIPVEKVYDR